MFRGPAVWIALFCAAAPARAEDAVLAIEQCSVFDSRRAVFESPRTIVVRGERIAAVAGPGEAPEIPQEARRIDGRGKFVLPGLIDAHVHLVHVLDFAHVAGDEVLPLYLAAGVTSIRSTGDEVVAATLVARTALRQPSISPRVFTCSPLLDADPPIHRDVGRAVTDPSQVGPLLDDLVAWQVRTVKIYAGTGRDVGRAIIAEGHRRNLFVTAHLGRYPAQQAVADGIDGLEHIWSVFNYVIPADAAPMPGHRGRVDFDHPLAADLIAELAKKKVFVDPTLSVFRNMILLCDEPQVRDHPDHALVPGRLKKFWPEYLRRTGCPQGGPLADRRREFGKYLELTGRLHRAGVPLLAGTDAPEPQVTPGFSLHQELELLVEAGLAPGAALQAATWNNARALRAEQELGEIAPGKLADLVILSSNPLDQISATRTIDVVIRGGIVCTPQELLRRVPRD